MIEENFQAEAKKLMDRLMEQIESQDDDDAIDVDYSNEVLTMHVKNKIFIINKQSSAKEIWLVSPLSGPHHFQLKAGAWISSKHHDIKKLLSTELSVLTNQTIKIL